MRFAFFAGLVNVVQNPAIWYLYAGTFLLGCYAYINYLLYIRLRDVGSRNFILFFLAVQIPARYLRLRAKYGWSPWPVYLMWFPLVLGAGLYFLGASKL